MTPVVLHGDCIEVMRTLPDASVDAVVTDPPYALEFLGREWDQFRDGRFQHWCEEWATECLRLLKPGGHLLAFGGTRTFHRLAAGVEDAGFEIRDSIAWLYGSGFPKSLDVSKAIDKAAGATREVVGKRNRILNRTPSPNWKKSNEESAILQGQAGLTANSGVWSPITAPATADAATWDGWGTALKPGFEPVVVARKPLVGTVAANVVAHGTGALNIAACRLPTEADLGRWPANVALDSDQAAALDRQSGNRRGFASQVDLADSPQGGIFDRKGSAQAGVQRAGFNDHGGASRFFYAAKATTAERPKTDSVQHPTVKPLDLMQWLVRLVTPHGGTVLEPFAGSGTTVEACLREGFHCIAIEREADYLPLIAQRIARSQNAVVALDGWDETS